ncbi:uncharacterized protein LOC132698065 [Cylas formicarius]|uniref:uncharacterized protein LOC132698065 n=1 Tax=Cylas formicarius TaxID=197179 RepID=UPI00295877DD|nr:uncharacterized protein LOC132698065 [Cylas formicarius]
MTVGGTQMATRGEVRYLGVYLDTRLTFWSHTVDKAASKTAALSHLMTNTRGPKQKTPQLLMTVTHSILLHGAEIWGGAMEVKKYQQAMLSVQRQGTLRIACAYRTVPESAVLVIAGVIPIGLLALERKSVYERSMELGRARASKKARNVTMDDWQTRWTNGTDST